MTDAAAGHPLDVVVSGMGVVCAVADDVDQLRNALLEAESGLSARPVAGSRQAWVAGVITAPLPPAGAIRPGQALTRHEHLAVTAARQAVVSAGLVPTDISVGDVGVYAGACQGGLTLQGTASPSAPLAERVARNGLHSLADAVALALGFDGPRVVTSNACAASASAIAVAAEELMAGRIRVAVVGGADGLEHFTLEGFSSLASIDPDGCSPYHRSGGLTVGEGAGFLVLERRAPAERRGARIRGTLLGWGASADAYHPTTPDPTGRGAATAVERALLASHCDPKTIDYISGHGTGTLTNDSMELRAFSSVFRSCDPLPRLSSTKSMVGHTLGAASAIESIATLLAMEGGFFPPTTAAGARPLSPTGCAPFDVVSDRAPTGSPKRSVKTSYAFGGSNYALVWGRADVRPPPESGRDSRMRAVVTGLGVLGPAGIGLDAWSEALRSRTSIHRQVSVGRGDRGRRRVLVGLCPDLGNRRPATLNAWRRMDRLSRRCVVAADAALDDARITRGAGERESIMILLASAAGPVTTLLEYRTQMGTGDQRRMAALFPNTALNAAAGHVAASMGLRGGIASFTSGGLSSDAALRHAADLIEGGRYERVLVIAAEELNREFVELIAESDVVPLAGECVDPFDETGPGLALSEATVCLLLESEDAAHRRDAPVHGRYVGAGVRGGGDRPTAATWSSAIETALATGSLGANDVDVTFAAAAGLGLRDQGERQAVASCLPQTTVVPIKAVLGDALGASGAVAAAAAMLGFRTNDWSKALVNSVSMCGQCCSTVWCSPEPGDRNP